MLFVFYLFILLHSLYREKRRLIKHVPQDTRPVGGANAQHANFVAKQQSAERAGGKISELF